RTEDFKSTLRPGPQCSNSNSAATRTRVEVRAPYQLHCSLSVRLHGTGSVLSRLAKLGLERLVLLVTVGLGHVGQCDLQDVIDPFDRTNIQSGGDVFGDLPQIALVIGRDDHGLDPTAVSRQEFFLQAADAKLFTAQGDLTGHGHLRTHGDVGQHRHQGRAHGESGTGTVLGSGSFRDVNVNVEVLVPVGRDA